MIPISTTSNDGEVLPDRAVRFHDENQRGNDADESFDFFCSSSPSSMQPPVHSNTTNAVMGTTVFGGGLVFGNGSGASVADGDDDDDATMMMPPPPPVNTSTDWSDKENRKECTQIGTAAVTATVTSKTFQSLLVSVNEGLEGCLSEHKQTTTRFFAVLEEWSQTAAQVRAEWLPLQEAEHAEADRLATLQGEVHGSVHAFFGNSPRAVGGGQ